MARSRSDLHDRLIDILGSRNVYFQPPMSMKIKYPAIVYKRDGLDVKRADNISYQDKKRYSVTVIDEDPDSEIPDKVLTLLYSSFDRHYAIDGLNHDVYTVYF